MDSSWQEKLRRIDSRGQGDERPEFKLKVAIHHAQATGEALSRGKDTHPIQPVGSPDKAGWLGLVLEGADEGGKTSPGNQFITIAPEITKATTILSATQVFLHRVLFVLSCAFRFSPSQR